MKINIPRWFLRIKKILRLHEELQAILKTEEPLYAKLKAQKDLFVSYHEFLRDCLKTHNIYLYYPTEIFKTANKLNLIDDANIWLDYIHDLNVLNSQTDKEEITNIIQYFLETYSDKFDNIVDTVKNLQKKFSNIKIEFQNAKINYNLTKHTNKEMGLSDEIYQILMNFFKEYPEIRYVWLHGSRTKGAPKLNTDIDLIIDSPIQTFETILTKIENLRIPNYIDAKNLYNADNQDFINTVFYQKPWLIYKLR